MILRHNKWRTAYIYYYSVGRIRTTSMILEVSLFFLYAIAVGDCRPVFGERKGE